MQFGLQDHFGQIKNMAKPEKWKLFIQLHLRFMIMYQTINVELNLDL